MYHGHMKIKAIHAQEILDSRGNPTVKASVVLENGMQASASVPSGASTGSYEAVELRDGDKTRYQGKGVLTAVGHVNDVIAQSLNGMNIESQEEIDNRMIQIDGTENKANLGANAILAVSMAIARAAALSLNTPLYSYIAHLTNKPLDHFVLPVPMINVINGGKHAAGASDFQEYMFIPHGAQTMAERVRWGSEVFHVLGDILKKAGFQTLVGDEGGYAPPLGSNTKPLELMVQAIEEAGYTPGKDISLGLDTAASSFYETGTYKLATENRQLSSMELTELYSELIARFPLTSLEDGHAEDDWAGFQSEMEAFGHKVQIVGDDLFVTNIKRLQKGIDMKAANSILVKVNQIGTVIEAIKAIQLAEKNNMKAVVSHRSGETEDTFIADFAVGTGIGQIKTGSMSRSERVAKYNRLLEIEAELLLLR